MRKHITIMGASVILFLALLGAGCQKTIPPPVPSAPAAPAANAPAAPVASDPLADDLDAAIEDLNAIE